MAGKVNITIVGPGNLGRALAQSLREAGYGISEIISRDSAASRKRAQQVARIAGGARAVTVQQASLTSDVLWLCVPDREIANAACELATRGKWQGKVALHASGALDSGELRALREQGAAVASLHPLMTFVAGSVPDLRGAWFAVEGDRAAVNRAREIVRRLRGHVFIIRKDRKPAYHAWGGFTSPLLVALFATGEEVASLAGITPAQARQRMLPIVRQTLRNYETLGASGAFSGPIIRGDLPTIEKHLRVLRKAPNARAVYLALAQEAIRKLPVGDPKALAKVLQRGKRKF